MVRIPLVFDWVDNTDPTVGINYMYINGDDMACPGPRSFWLELTCKDNEYNIPDEEPVFETNCVYKVSIDSIYGCPIGSVERSG